MADLKLTPTRVAVLRAIADPNVKIYRCRNSDTFDAMTIWQQPDSTERLVTSIADRLEDAGLIRTGAASGPSYYARRPWELTPAGEQALAKLDAKEVQP